MVCWEISRARTALILVDVNNNFFAEGMPFYVPSSQEIVRNLKDLLYICRTLKVPVIFTTQCYACDGSNLGLAAQISTLDYPPVGRVACENTDGVEIFNGVKPQGGDIVIEKSRYSSFYKTDLESTLRGLGVDTLILAGVVTDCCINTTAFDAFQRDFRVVVVSDGTAARDERTHTVMLNTISRVAGEVTTVKDIIARLQGAQPNG